MSDAPPGRYTTKDMALDAKEVLEAIGWLPAKRELHLVGSSMGGMVSLQLSFFATTSNIIY
jgi:pimeloyl-ACP methyl ester carboxylesterase